MSTDTIPVLLEVIRVRSFQEKSITSRWLDPETHSGINLGFPQND